MSADPPPMTSQLIWDLTGAGAGADAGADGGADTGTDGGADTGATMLKLPLA